jgi:hypothetical protein
MFDDCQAIPHYCKWSLFDFHLVHPANLRQPVINNISSIPKQDAGKIGPLLANDEMTGFVVR